MAKWQKKGSETAEFLLNLNSPQGQPSEGLVELRAMSPEGPCVARQFCSSIGAVEAFVEKYGKKEDKLAVYYGVGLRRNKSDGKKENVVSVPGFWSDIDVGKHGWDFEKVVRYFHDLPGILQPTALVHSGGGLHAYWLFDTPLVLDSSFEDWHLEVRHFEEANRAFCRHTAGDNVFDLSRVLRLPGSYNCRRAKPCHVIWFYRWHRHDAATLREALSEFNLFLTGDGFVEEADLPAMPQGSSATNAWHFAKDMGKGARSADKLANLWASTRLGGGYPFYGLDEAQLLATAYLWQFPYAGDGGINGKKAEIVDKVLRQTRIIKAQYANGDVWDMEAEREKIAAKLDRWEVKWNYIAEARAQEKKLADKLKREEAKKAKADKEGRTTS